MRLTIIDEERARYKLSLSQNIRKRKTRLTEPRIVEISTQEKRLTKPIIVNVRVSKDS